MADPQHLVPGPVVFHHPMGAWWISRDADVRIALAAPGLVMVGAPEGDRADAGMSTRTGMTATHAERPARVPEALWQSLDTQADALCATLPDAGFADLMARVIRPWSAALAQTLTGVAPAQMPEALALAHTVFAHAAHATSGAARGESNAAVLALAQRLMRDEPWSRDGDGLVDHHGGGTSPRDTLPPALRVQAFIALAESLPALVAGMWHVLFTQPALRALLVAQPTQLPSLMPELLRRAGPTRAVFRVVQDTTVIDGITLNPNDAVVLWLGAANHDPARFPDPFTCNAARTVVAHHTFGGGSRHCVGAAMVQQAAMRLTARWLLSPWASARVTPDTVEPAQWLGGVALDAPRTLPVVYTTV